MNYFEGFEEETVAFLNPCHPFFRMETLGRAIDHFRESEAVSMTSVVKSHTWYYHLDGRPINFLDPTVINTKATERLLAVAHAFHIFPRKRFLEHGYMWRHAPRDPVFFEIPEREAIDVDTELDFEIAEALYERLARGTRDPGPC
jgi:CMP-N-acetylneuraminic acid synthetase